MAKKIDASTLKSMLAAEKADSLSAMRAAKLSEERARALNYYVGEMPDLKPAEGRSGAVSTDVADTVEGMMPQLMEIFSGDEVVRFEPVGPEDVQAAAQETDYVNHVFMQQNPGFMVLYSFIKDALLSKTGIVKVYWDEGEEVQRETYLDIDDASFTMLASNPEVEIVEHTKHPAPAQPNGDGAGGAVPALGGVGVGVLGEGNAGASTHDVTVETKQHYEFAKVEAVPPEEFGIGRNDRYISDAGYCFHDVLRREEDLITEGYDADQIKELPSYTGLTNIETAARNTVEEPRGGSSDGVNKANRLLKITEHYVRMDYEGDGKPGLYRVVTGGTGDAEVLRKDGKEVIVREDIMPFAAITPVPQTHRFFGRSIADLVMDIQRIKTVLTRGTLDNLYALLNPRPVVAEEGASDTTFDDIAIVRHGQPIRVKRDAAGTIIWQAIPDVTQSIYPMLQYQDATREWRTGVSRQGQGVDPEALQNQVATIANQMEEASQAKIKLIARIFAETGIKDLFMLLHGIIRKNGTQAQTVRLRNQWVQVDPRDWKQRNDMTINVGLGTGNKAQQLAGLQLIAGVQEKLIALGMISKKQAYNTAAKIAKATGHADPEEFFGDPAKPPAQDDPSAAPIQPPPDPKMAELQMKGQMEQQKLAQSAEIEKVQAQADIATNDRKVQADAMLQQQKFGHEAELAEKEFQLKKELALIEAQIKVSMHDKEMEFKEREHGLKMQDMAVQSEVKQRESQQAMAMRDHEHQTKMVQSEADGQRSEKEHKQKLEQAKASKPEKPDSSNIDKRLDGLEKLVRAKRVTTIVRDAKGKAQRAESSVVE